MWLFQFPCHFRSHIPSFGGWPSVCCIFTVSKQWYGSQSLGPLTCAHRSDVNYMIAHGGCTNTYKTLTVGEKSLAAPGSQSCISSTPDPTLKHLSYIPTPSLCLTLDTGVYLNISGTKGSKCSALQVGSWLCWPQLHHEPARLTPWTPVLTPWGVLSKANTHTKMYSSFLILFPKNIQWRESVSAGFVLQGK